METVGTSEQKLVIFKITTMQSYHDKLSLITGKWNLIVLNRFNLLNNRAIALILALQDLSDENELSSPETVLNKVRIRLLKNRYRLDQGS